MMVWDLILGGLNGTAGGTIAVARNAGGELAVRRTAEELDAGGGL